MSIQISDYEKKKFAIFKSIYEIDDFNKRIEYIRVLCRDIKDIIFLPTMYNSFFLAESRLDTLRIKEQYSKITYELYPELLGKMKKLATELKLSNSLELAYLCNHLMCEGFLSKNKLFNFQSEGRIGFRGLMFVDIINGVGVCSNLATLEKDFLNFCGYNSCVMSNNMPQNAMRFYELNDSVRDDYIRQAITYKQSLSHFINDKVFMKNAHMFTIIEEQEKLYAYDPTNAIILELTGPFSSEIITGYGFCRLQPYFSLYANDGLNALELIAKMFEKEDLSSPYNNADFCHMMERLNNLLKRNTKLLDDFHSDIYPYIEEISVESTKIDAKRKNYVKRT